MRRAAVSVSANVAEGCGRQGDVELRRFLRISLGSLAELECEVLLSANLKFVEPESCRGICSEIRLVRRMLQRLHQSLPSKPTNPRPS
jgi:four helix bundle protein